MHTPQTILGHLAQDPELRQFTNGEQEPSYKCRLRVAASRRRLREGTWQDSDLLFLNVDCWGETAKNAKRSLAKGYPVVCIGHLTTEEWEASDGTKRQEVLLKANHVAFDISKHVIGVKRSDQPDAGSANASTVRIPSTDPADLQPDAIYAVGAKAEGGATKAAEDHPFGGALVGAQSAEAPF